MKTPKSKTFWAAALALVGAALIAGAVYFFAFMPRPPVPEAVDPKAPETALVHLYFGHPAEPLLVAEPRYLPLPANLSARALTIMEALLEGPKQEAISVIPEGTLLNSVYVDENGVCFVDFSRGIITNHPGGSAGELMTIWSVVNTLVLNVDGIYFVKLLIDGQQEETLAGHLDIRKPLGPDLRLIQ
ncbi:MAG: GerMN domain-containing protein [Desulfatibacillaceae bacterium]|nr:GerMN domain-containing protein [Desulfatibacillaceae bacterium]